MFEEIIAMFTAVLLLIYSCFDLFKQTRNPVSDLLSAKHLKPLLHHVELKFSLLFLKNRPVVPHPPVHLASHIPETSWRVSCGKTAVEVWAVEPHQEAVAAWEEASLCWLRYRVLL